MLEANLANVILSEAEESLAISARDRRNNQRCLKALASCFVFRCSASLNITIPFITSGHCNNFSRDGLRCVPSAVARA
jgi:hypothetical protein